MTRIEWIFTDIIIKKIRANLFDLCHPCSKKDAYMR